MFTVWLDKNLTKALPEKYLCQLTRQKAYAELHNYSYFIFTEPDKGWFEEKSDFELTIPWFKLYTFRRLLASDTHYDWIVYIDTDAIPKDPKLPFEVLFRENPRASLLLRDDKGWNTHAIFLKKNSGFSHWLLDYTWSLRKKFNNCVKEQCALNLALFEAIKREELRKDMAQRYSLKPSSSLCCNPAITLPKNHQNAQGCTWTLQEATKVREKNKHPHIHWIQGDNRKLNILHPLKTMECDDVANLSPSSLPLVPPIRQNWTYLILLKQETGRKKFLVSKNR